MKVKQHPGAMQEYQQRVVEEKKALDEKLEKLNAFINSDAWNKLEQEDQKLLSAQCSAMEEYSDILQQRISRF